MSASPSFEILPAAEISFEEQAQIANAAFEGYVAGWTALDATSLARFLCLQGSDLFYSRFIRNGNRLVGFGYITRTGDLSRISAMGVIPDARGTGASRMLLLHLLGEARERCDHAVMLEVFEQNPRAHRLYRRHGFRDVGRLFGWRRTAHLAASSSALAEPAEIPMSAALQLPFGHDYPEVPWQISRYALAKAVGTHAYQCRDCCVIVGDLPSAPLRIHAFLGEQPGAIAWPKRRAALQEIISRYPAREILAPPIFPEAYGSELFEPLGFQREPLNQFLMRCEL